MSETNDKQRPELRAALLASARKLFLEQPYEQVRVDDIAADAGVAKGLAFYYFKNKRGLYVAVVQELMGELIVRALPDPELPPRQREVTAVGNFVDWAAETDGVEIILSTWSAGDAKIDAVFRGAGERLIIQTIDAMSDFPGGIGEENELLKSVLARSIWGWLAFARIVTSDWLRKRDTSKEQLRDLLVGALDGVVISARKIAADHA